MAKRKAQNKPRLTKKQYQDIQMKQLAKKVAEHQKILKDKSLREMEERKNKSLSKKELQQLKKEKKEALRQYTLKKVELQRKKNKQIKDEWNRIQDNIKDEINQQVIAEDPESVSAQEIHQEKKRQNAEALEKMASYGWKIRSNFEADADLVGDTLTRRKKMQLQLKNRYGVDETGKSFQEEEEGEEDYGMEDDLPAEGMGSMFQAIPTEEDHAEEEQADDASSSGSSSDGDDASSGSSSDESESD